MPWFPEEDVSLGSFAEIGESLRGMQDTQVGAAQAQLRSALSQLAGAKFGPHAPLQKHMRSPYKDSTQIGIKCIGTFTPASWTGSSLPTVSGKTRVYKSFKPTKAIVTELLVVTFTNSSGTAQGVASVSDSADLVLISAFSGADNCFPTAPDESTGISGPTFANNSLGNGISWPTINGGIDMTVSFAVEMSVLAQVAPPAGFTSQQITSVAITVRFNLLGPSLR
jgi:hypothetical protein